MMIAKRPPKPHVVGRLRHGGWVWVYKKQIGTGFSAGYGICQVGHSIRNLIERVQGPTK